MKKIHIKDDIYALVDDEDFERVNAYKWCLNSNGYACTSYACGFKPDGKVKQRGMLMHRFIMNLVKGDPQLDHMDVDRLNNQKDNLRFATQGENARNRPRHSNNKSGYKGVNLHKPSGLWRACIVKDGKDYTTYHHDKVEAALSYNAMAIKLHGEFARLNVI
jgi:AP2 domain